MLWQRELPGADVVIRGARVLDPAEGIDARLEVRIDGGTIAEVAETIDANGHRVVDAEGLVLAPAFVDPHVHLRTPGREDEETVASGTAAAAAGGYCAILAMPNTDPVVDSAATLGALVEAARREAEVPVGFLAAITRGQRGEELTEMGELADTGAVAFSDDGMPVASAGMMRRALQYASTTGRPLALHCEEPTLSHGGHVHEGRVAAELGFAGYPSVAESVAVERDLALAGYERGRVHVLHLSAAESVDALRRAREAGVAASGEATPHHLVLTDDAVRSLDPNVKMNPPLRAEQDRVALLEAVRDGTIEAIATDHAPHAAHEKDVPFEAAPFGVTGLETAFASLYTHLVEPGLLPLETLLERMSSRAGTDLRARPAAGRRRRPGESRPARPRAGVDGRRAALPLAVGQLVAARIEAEGSGANDARRRRGGLRMSYLALADGTVWHGESVGAEGHALGEAVFTTGMSGYQEAVTDPSFEDQLICFTAPMVGNYGVAEERNESARTHARAVLMREARGPEWTDWLREHGIVALTGIDTRSLVLHLRDAGSAPADRGRVGPRGRAGDRARGTAALDARARARRRRLDGRAVRLRGGGPRADRRRGLRRQELGAAAARQGGRGGHRPPARHGRRRARRLRRRPSLAGPRRSRAARRGDRDGEAAARPDARDGHLPRPPADRARDRARDVQAPVRPPRREPPGARAASPAACS